MVLKIKRTNGRNGPNKPERKLLSLLEELQFPYVYNGNAEFLLIGGTAPDYINVNGQKKLIEHYGCYWHCCPLCNKREWKREDKQREDAETLEGYAMLGNKTLVIWEHELKDVEAVKEKLLEFERL